MKHVMNRGHVDHRKKAKKKKCSEKTALNPRERGRVATSIKSCMSGRIVTSVAAISPMAGTPLAPQMFNANAETLKCNSYDMKGTFPRR